MSKTNSRTNIVPPHSKGSLFVPTLLSLALISAFSSSAIAANSGGSLSEDGYSYGNWTNLTNNNVIIDTSFDGSVFGASTETNNQIVSGNNVSVKNDTSSVTIAGSVIGGDIYVVADEENVTSQAISNSVSISKDVTIGNYVAGGFSESVILRDGSVSAEASQNIVKISGATLDGNGDYRGYVYGGLSEAVLAVQETPDGLVGGNGAASAIADNNTVSISDGAVIGDVNQYYGGVTGGYAYVEVAFGDALESNGFGNATANNNSVTIASNSKVGDDASGGYVWITAKEGTASVNTNTMTISDAYVEGGVYGGYAEVRMDGTVSANANTVNISNSYFSEDVISGYVLVDGTVSAVADASNNTLIIDGSKSYVDFSAMGGYIEVELENNGTATATANNNTVVVSGGAEIDEMVVGGSIGDLYDDDIGIELNAGGTANAYANDNTVSVLDSKVGDEVLGGYIYVDTYGEESTTVNVYANNNIVTISNSTVAGSVYGGRVNVYGTATATATATANNNTVVVSGGAEIDEVVAGGSIGDFYLTYPGIELNAGGTANAYANDNTVSVLDSKVGGVVGGYIGAGAYGEESATVNVYANNNTMVISNSTVEGDSTGEGDVMGAVAFANADDDKAGASATAYANNNTVTISNSKVSGVVLGGYVDAGGGNTNIEQASYNTVIIDSADELNINGANAVLKVLEEPPAKSLLLLISHNPSKLLPTIKSRCAKIHLQPLSVAEVASLLRRYSPELSEAEVKGIAAISSGSIGHALRYAEHDGLKIYKTLENLFYAGEKFDLSTALELSDKVAKDEELWDLTTELIGHFLKENIISGEKVEQLSNAGEQIRIWLKDVVNLNTDKKQVMFNIINTVSGAF